MPLKEYIEKYYNGNQSAFSAAIGKSRQQVSRWIASGEWHVYEGKLMQEKITVPTPQ
ncbi:hypothetical protein [Salmonella enterica]|uniref:hypothetical protein n=1 Tax=Salmonella enterica TaxID=28901 RepID=UPI0014369E33|nr:hypothetical protein [Salmonella enterica]